DREVELPEAACANLVDITTEVMGQVAQPPAHLPKSGVEPCSAVRQTGYKTETRSFGIRGNGFCA
ncbi:hypothetical protein, partial [Acetobacter okinawensis]|uniref:hypothetical protein n=1 Tax=Acetobacter okinawensis TaxID=1076594 RepID=UPI001BAE0DE8